MFYEGKCWSLHGFISNQYVMHSIDILNLIDNNNDTIILTMYLVHL